MIDSLTYTYIQIGKNKSYDKIDVANNLRISKETVRKYWDMTENEFESRFLRVNKLKSMKKYKSLIVSLIQSNVKISTKKLYEDLKDKLDDDISLRTFERYVAEIRKQYRLMKNYP